MNKMAIVKDLVMELVNKGHRDSYSCAYCAECESHPNTVTPTYRERQQQTTHLRFMKANLEAMWELHVNTGKCMRDRDMKAIASDVVAAISSVLKSHQKLADVSTFDQLWSAQAVFYRELLSSVPKHKGESLTKHFHVLRTQSDDSAYIAYDRIRKDNGDPQGKLWCRIRSRRSSCQLISTKIMYLSKSYEQLLNLRRRLNVDETLVFLNPNSYTRMGTFKKGRNVGFSCAASLKRAHNRMLKRARALKVQGSDQGPR